MENTKHPTLSMQLTPVGVVRSEIKTPMISADQADLTPAQRMETVKAYHRRVEDTVCELVIEPQWAELLDGIDAFSHILVLYWPHLLDPDRREQKKVHPMGRKDMPLQGIFATCSPARPNPVLVSAVPLVARKGNVLEVRGLEAIDGSPIIDLKPYSQNYLHVDGLRIPEWMAQIHRELEID